MRDNSSGGPVCAAEKFDEPAYLALNPDVAQAVAAKAYASGREH